MAALQFSDSFVSELSRNTFVPILLFCTPGVVVDEDTKQEPARCEGHGWPERQSSKGEILMIIVEISER